MAENASARGRHAPGVTSRGMFGVEELRERFAALMARVRVLHGDLTDRGGRAHLRALAAEVRACFDALDDGADDPARRVAQGRIEALAASLCQFESAHPR